MKELIREYAAHLSGFMIGVLGLTAGAFVLLAHSEHADIKRLQSRVDELEAQLDNTISENRETEQ